MPSSPKQTDTTTTQKVELPAWVDAGGQENYALAKDIATTPYTPYTGGLTAGVNNGARQDASTSAYQASDAIYGGTQVSNQMAYGATKNAPSSVGLGGYSPLSINPMQVGAPSAVNNVAAQRVAGPLGVANASAATFNPADIDQYYNPYEKQVVASAQDAGQRSIDASQRTNSDNAIAAGAFGSSRHGVTEGVTAAEGARGIADTVGGIRSAGYTQALGALQADNAAKTSVNLANQQSALTTQDLGARVGIANQGADLTAQTANQNAGLSMNDLMARIGMSNQSADLSAQTANQGALSDRAKMQLAADQGNQSAGLQNAGQKLQAAGILSGNAGMQSDSLKNLSDLQSNTANLTQATQQSQLDKLQQQFQQKQDYPTEQLNLRLAALGMTPYGKTVSGTSSSTESGGDNPFLSILGGASSLKGLFGFSDPKLKKDVKTEGTGAHGLTVKSFNYRDDTGLDLPKGRQIGYMADEVERKMPDAVRRVPIGNGKTARQVDYGKTGLPGVFGFAKKGRAA